MVDYQALSIIFAGLSIAASILYYASVLRNQNKTQQMQLETRQAQMFMNIYDRFASSAPEHHLEIMKMDLKTYADFEKLFDDKEKYEALAFFNVYYEGIGVLVREKFVDVGLVAKLMSGNVIYYWEKYRDLFTDWRRERGNPRAMIELEYLYNEILEYGRKHPELGIREQSV